MRRRGPSPSDQRLFEVAPLPDARSAPTQPQLFEFSELPGRPVGGAGLFVDDLVLGPGNLHPEDEAALCAHLVAVARARRIPLHVAVAWNALYFDYDPEIPGYDLAAAPTPEPATIIAGAPTVAVPVGALVQFTYEGGGGVRREEWAEVVYKEGRPTRALNDDLVRPAYSGATESLDLDNNTNGTHETDGTTLQELLVLDFAPFGSLGAADMSWIERIRTDPKRPALDSAGHLLVDARYAPDSSTGSDLEFFGEWMLEHHTELLARGWLGAALDDPDNPEHLAEAMDNSLRAVEAVLERSGAFAEWGGYWYLKEDLAAFASDPDTPGGRADAGHLLSTLGSVPRRSKVAYHPLSLHLERLVRPDDLLFERYVRHIIYANALVTEALSERGDDGVIGHAKEQFGIRLDDGWLYGGTWRAERLDGTSVCPLVGFDPTITLALGANNEADDTHEPLPADESDDSAAETLDEESEEDTGSEEDAASEQGTAPEDDLLDEHHDDTHKAAGEPVTWSAVLRQAHRDDGRLFVHPDAKLVPTDDGTIVLRVTHAGEIEDDERSQLVHLSPNGAWLYPVRYPFDFFTGIRLSCLAQQGGAVVFAATEALPSAQDNDYGFAFDRSVLDPTRPRQREPQLLDRALRTIDRYGEDMGDRWHRLDADSIAELIFGAEVGTVGAQAITAALSQDPDLSSCDDAGMWWHHTAASGRRLFEASTRASDGFFAGASPRLAASVEAARRSQHRVVMHLRRLTVSERARPEWEAQYMTLRERAPNRARLPQTLPIGYTFVVSHTRGGHHE